MSVGGASRGGSAGGASRGGSMGGASRGGSSKGASHAGAAHGGKTGATHGGKTAGGKTHGKTAAHTAQSHKTAQGKHAAKTQQHAAKKTGHPTKDTFEAKPQNKKISDTVARLNPKGHYLAANEQTHCNAFAADYAKSMGDASLAGKTANQQYSHLSSPTSGYHKATAAEAMKAAAEGKLAFAAYSNPSGHGHIAAVVGETAGKPAIAQAGKKNYNFTGVNYGFGKASPPSYFVRS